MLTRFLCLQLPNFYFSLVSFIYFCSLFQVYRYLDFLASILEHPCAKVCYFCGVPISFWHLLLILPPPLPLSLSLSLSLSHTHTHTRARARARSHTQQTHICKPYISNLFHSLIFVVIRNCYWRKALLRC